MKSLLSFPVIILLIFLVSCSGGSNDLDRHGLKGKVMTTMEFQCDATYENEQWVAGIQCENGYRAVEYDTNGLYIKTFNMNIIAGRDFSKEFPVDSTTKSFIVNETSVKAMKLK